MNQYALTFNDGTPAMMISASLLGPGYTINLNGKKYKVSEASIIIPIGMFAPYISYTSLVCELVNG